MERNTIGSDKEHILYGVGGEAERFIFSNPDMLEKIKFCIDNNRTDFYGIQVCRLSEAKLSGGERILVAAGDEKMYREMKQNLENLGLTEFEDFIWTKVFRKKIVVVNANCHGPALIRYLHLSAVFCNNYMVYPLPMSYEMQEISSNLLKNADVYIHQDIRENNRISYKLSDAYICPQLKHDVIDICIPNFVGIGQWMFPSVTEEAKLLHMLSCDWNVAYRDCVLDEAIHGCKSLAEYKAFWTDYKFDGSEHDQNFDRCMRKLQERQKNWDIEIYDFIKENYRKIPCFVDHTHPSIYVMKEVGRQVAEILKLKDIDDENYVAFLGAAVPIMKDVINHFSLAFEVPYEVKREYLGRYVEDEVDDYIRAYLWWYHQIAVD